MSNRMLENKWNEVCASIMAGESLGVICARKDMPSHGEIKQALKRDTAKRKDYQFACKVRLSEREAEIISIANNKAISLECARLMIRLWKGELTKLDCSEHAVSRQVLLPVDQCMADEVYIMASSMIDAVLKLHDQSVSQSQV